MLLTVVVRQIFFFLATMDKVPLKTKGFVPFLCQHVFISGPLLCFSSRLQETDMLFCAAVDAVSRVGSRASSNQAQLPAFTLNNFAFGAPWRSETCSFFKDEGIWFSGPNDLQGFSHWVTRGRFLG